MMADFSSFTSKFRANTTGSRESPATKVMKRPRLVCNQCQKSKSRCDRGHPCSTCAKRDDAAACSYQRATGSRAHISRNTAVEERLLHLESMVTKLMQSQESGENGDSLVPAELVPLPVVADAVDDPRHKQVDNARYVGSTHWSAILDDIQELKVALDGSAGVQDEENATTDVPTLRKELIFGSSNDYSLQEIIAEYLPPRAEVDRLLSIYFQGEAFIVPFIHTHYFQRQYRDFWVDTAIANPLWLSMLFSVCSMASWIGGVIGSYPSSQTGLAKGHSNFYTASGQCLVVGEYDRPKQFAVEALALYAHCKNLGTLDPCREAGAIFGMVIRVAYGVGYHRDPDSFGTFTVFEGEMRRRFWAASKQMDLMISFQLGLPSNICLENCDTKSPGNLLDSDFDVDTQVLPASRSENEATRLLWFIVKERQMISFSKVCQDSLSFKEKSEAEIVRLDKEIREMYLNIPDILRARPLSESIADPPFLNMTRLYVDFIYLKSFCVLHRKYMTRGSVFSTKSCIEAGERLVGQFIDMYKEFSPGGQIFLERWMLGNFTMNDFSLGTMVLCLVVHINRTRGARHSPIDAVMEKRVLALLEQAHAICLENSTASGDARRVSHAVRLTLNSVKSPYLPNNDVWQSLLTSRVSSSDVQQALGEVEGVDLTSLSLPPWLGYSREDEMGFGMLEPFNFMVNDVENLDWTVFDPKT